MKRIVLTTIIGAIMSLSVIAAETKPESKNDAGAPVSTWIAAKRDGVVIDLKVKLGDYVKEGQPLLVLGTGFNKIDLEANKKKIIFYKDIVKKGSKYKGIILSKDTYDKIVKDLDTAIAAKEEAEAAIKNSTYYAPFDGTITDIKYYKDSGIKNNSDAIEVTEGQIKVDRPAVADVCIGTEGVLTTKVKLKERVKKGQELFQVDDNELVAKLKALKADLKYKEKVFQRNKKLSKNSVSFIDYIDSGIDVIDAIGEMKKQEMKIQGCYKAAPFNGIVTKIYRYTGSGTGNNKPIVQIQEVK